MFLRTDFAKLGAVTDVNPDVAAAIASLRSAITPRDILNLQLPVSVCRLKHAQQFYRYFCQRAGLGIIFYRSLWDIDTYRSEAFVTENGDAEYAMSKLHPLFHGLRDAVLDAERRAAPNGHLPEGVRFIFEGGLNTGGTDLHTDGEDRKARIYICRPWACPTKVVPHNNAQRIIEHYKTSEDLERSLTGWPLTTAFYLEDQQPGLKADLTQALQPIGTDELVLISGSTYHQGQEQADGPLFTAYVSDP